MRELANGTWLTADRVRSTALVSAVAGAAMLAFLMLAGEGTLDPFGQPVGTDFTAFWHAGQLANAGQPSSAWDVAALNTRVHATHPTSDFMTTWTYPPAFLLVASPLASLPYLPALLLWQVLSLLLLTLVLQGILQDRKAVLVCLASPLTPLVLAHGQNAFLTAAVLGGGLLLLGKRPGLAGTLLGALVYKPHLAVVIGPLLLFGGKWRALAAAAISAAAIIAAATAIWGLESWTAFAASMGYGRFYLEQGSVGFFKNASLFSMARQWGASVAISYAVQLLGTLSALLLVWRCRAARPHVRAAAACTAAALSTPYLMDYDMAVVGVGAAFLYMAASETRFLPFERSALAFIWAAPWFSRPFAEHAALPLGPLAMLLVAWFAWHRAEAGEVSSAPQGEDAVGGAMKVEGSLTLPGLSPAR